MQAGVGTAINVGSFKDNLNGALSSQLQGVLQAVAFNAVGDLADQKNWTDGGIEKTALHALVGGMLSEAAGPVAWGILRGHAQPRKLETPARPAG